MFNLTSSMFYVFKISFYFTICIKFFDLLESANCSYFMLMITVGWLHNSWHINIILWDSIFFFYFTSDLVLTGSARCTSPQTELHWNWACYCEVHALWYSKCWRGWNLWYLLLVCVGKDMEIVLFDGRFNINVRLLCHP